MKQTTRPKVPADVKRGQNVRYWNQKRAAGWKQYSFLIPPEVGEQVRLFKGKLMSQYRELKAQERANLREKIAKMQESERD